MTILDRHIHRPKNRPPQQHRLIALDSTHLRCLDCQETLDVAGLAVPTGDRRSTAPRDPLPEQTCPRHPGEFRQTCRCCASETKARRECDPPPISQVRTGADPTAIPEWQATKAQMADRRAQARRQAAAGVSQPDASGVGVAQGSGVGAGSAAAGMQAAADAGGVVAAGPG